MGGKLILNNTCTSFLKLQLSSSFSAVCRDSTPELLLNTETVCVDLFLICNAIKNAIPVMPYEMQSRSDY